MRMMPRLAATSTYFRKDERTGWEISRGDGTFRSRRTFRMKIEGERRNFNCHVTNRPKEQIDEEEKNNLHNQDHSRRERESNGMDDGRQGKTGKGTECRRTSSSTKIIINNFIITSLLLNNY